MKEPATQKQIAAIERTMGRLTNQIVRLATTAAATPAAAGAAARADRDERVLAVVRSATAHGISRGAVMARTGMTLGQVRRGLDALREAGLVRVSGKNSAARWHARDPS